MRRAERPFAALPRPLLLGLVLFIGLQFASHYSSGPSGPPVYQPLTPPFTAETYQALALGSPRLLAYLLAMRLQLHDNQAGRHIPYSRVDYPLLVDWLEQISLVYVDSEYPMMLAARVYSQTRDQAQLRVLLGFIERGFLRAPQLHWRRLAEATVIAKHQLGDLRLALRFADLLAAQPNTVKMPRWARDLRFLLLGDLNEFESAIAIILGLLQGDTVQDPDERRFLQEKLSHFQQKLFESQQFQPE